MGTETNPLPPQEGQPVTPPAPPEGAQKPEVKPLTAEQIREVAKALVGDPEISKQFKRSLFQHADARVEQVINQRLTDLQQMGIQPTLDQVAQISAQAARELQSPPPQPPAAQPVVQPPAQPEADEQLDPIAQAAYSMMEAENTVIEDDDPEIAKIKLDGTPLEYLESVQEAIKDKKQRLADQENPALRVPGAGSGSGEAGAVPEGLSPYQLMKMGYAKRK